MPESHYQQIRVALGVVDKTQYPAECRRGNANGWNSYRMDCSTAELDATLQSSNNRANAFFQGYFKLTSDTSLFEGSGGHEAVANQVTLNQETSQQTRTLLRKR